MSRGPETRLIQSVHKLLDKETYREKMHNEYRGGTPDCWYSNKKGDMWVEWKWDPRPLVGRIVKPKLSPLQLLWLTRRAEEGRNVRVMVGGPDGVAVLFNSTEWTYGLRVALVLTKKEAAAHIEAMTLKWGT